MRLARALAGFLWLAMAAGVARGDDWPMWRHDARRWAHSGESLPARLHLEWVRQFPPPQPAYWQERQQRLQFDRGYEPIVVGQTLLVGSSADDSLTALDTRTGRQRWRFFADGPIRLAPVAADGRVWFGADDGCVYCLQVDDGRLVWKFRAVPAPRQVLGNGRLISVWPVRGGPVLADGRLYFAAGVWPFEGIFVYALDAATGKVVWLNDRLGSMYVEHPHGALSFGGPSPQGYLAIRGAQLVVPSSRAFPALLNVGDGALVDFAFGHGGHGSVPGSWLVAVDPQGQLCVDPELNTEIHDAGRQIVGQKGVRRQDDEPVQESIQVGGQTYRIVAGLHNSLSAGGRDVRLEEPLPELAGPYHAKFVADGRLFVVTTAGAIAGFGPEPVEPRRWPAPTEPDGTTAGDMPPEVAPLVKQAPAQTGFALVANVKQGRLVDALLEQTRYHVIVLDEDRAKIDALRQRWAGAGVYGRRVAARVGTAADAGLPPYMFTLITAEEPARWLAANRPAEAAALLAALRPYGGALCLPLATAEHADFTQQFQRAAAGDKQFVVRRTDDVSWVARPGPLPGAAEYRGAPNFDALVKAPLGLLWYGDTHLHHKLYYRGYLVPDAGRGLPDDISISGGLLRYTTTRTPVGANPPGVKYADYLAQMYRQLNYTVAWTDVFTGRVLSDDEASPQLPPAALAVTDEEALATARQRREPGPAPAVLRRNPLTGVVESREFLKTYGCDRWPVDYGNVLTLRSGTAAFYDARCDSGTINISGTRSGCRNNVVPGDGVLCVPSWTGNCTCNYPVFTSLALRHMDDDFEQWAAWGGVAVEAPVQRVGINFGAPGDRMAADGTLWIDCPSVGGPSPNVPVHIEPPDAVAYYRHALFMQGGQGWPWVTASGLRGVTRLRIEPIARRSEPADGFSVRWTGGLAPQSGGPWTLHLETDAAAKVWIDDQLILDSSRNRRRGQSQAITAAAALRSAQPTPIVVEYSHPRASKEPGQLSVRWSRADGAAQTIPAAALISAQGAPGGLTGAYYDNSRLAGPGAVHVDAPLEFQWPAAGPAALQRPAPDAAERTFTVRLYFAEPDEIAAGQRVFDVRLQGRTVVEKLDVVAAAGGWRRGLVRQFAAVAVGESLEVELVPRTPLPAVISGIELIRQP